jgi:hypothetical protein
VRREEGVVALGGFAQVSGEEGVEFGVEHADYFGGFVGDDCFCCGRCKSDITYTYTRLIFRREWQGCGLTFLFVPQRGHKISPSILRIRLQIQLLQGSKTVQRLLLVAWLPGHGPPRAIMHSRRVPDNQLDDVFEPLEAAHDVCAVRPGTAVVDVQRIAVFFCGEFGVWVRGNEVAEGGGFAVELAVLVGETLVWRWVGGLCVCQVICSYMWR